MPGPPRPLGRGMSGIGAAVLAAALVVAGVAAWWLRARDGALRSPAGREDGGMGAVDVLQRLGAVPGSAELTVVPADNH